MGQFVLNMIKNGYSLVFNDPGPPSLSHFLLNVEAPRDHDVRQYLVLEASKLLEKGAVKVILDQTSLGFYSQLFLVAKSDAIKNALHLTRVSSASTSSQKILVFLTKISSSTTFSQISSFY